MSLEAKSEKFWKLIEKNADIKQVGTGFTFTEGPVFSRRGFLLFSDIPNKKITEVGARSAYYAPRKQQQGEWSHVRSPGAAPGCRRRRSRDANGEERHGHRARRRRLAGPERPCLCDRRQRLFL